MAMVLVKHALMDKSLYKQLQDQDQDVSCQEKATFVSIVGEQFPDKCDSLIQDALVNCTCGTSAPTTGGSPASPRMTTISPIHQQHPPTLPPVVSESIGQPSLLRQVAYSVLWEFYYNNNNPSCISSITTPTAITPTLSLSCGHGGTIELPNQLNNNHNLTCTVGNNNNEATCTSTTISTTTTTTTTDPLMLMANILFVCRGSESIHLQGQAVSLEQRNIPMCPSQDNAFSTATTTTTIMMTTSVMIQYLDLLTTNFVTNATCSSSSSTAPMSTAAAVAAAAIAAAIPQTNNTQTCITSIQQQCINNNNNVCMGILPNVSATQNLPLPSEAIL
eukprot:CAMPEP_0116549518 /NCGR_PEP_ID=MMETSP0397-20121206/4921_1 /TAXON_ID=216820 /ORGANISM="Cyclophora tenuis, Strain ECT3854" /LENGTH=332 /DNA_ID=CAMNT_0004074257 /DNA_START=127 /DNA_END=1125 /DNA_ORIENTATION=+